MSPEDAARDLLAAIKDTVDHRPARPALEGTAKPDVGYYTASLAVAVRALYAAGWRLTLGGGEMVDRLAIVHVDTHERQSVWSAPTHPTDPCGDSESE